MSLLTQMVRQFKDIGFIYTDRRQDNCKSNKIR